MSEDGVVPARTNSEGGSVSRPMRVGIIGHVGNENLGDESIIAAVIQNIRRRFPEVEINGFTLNPVDTEARHGVVSFPIRRQIYNYVPGSSENSEAEPSSSDPSLAHRAKEWIKTIPILSSVARWTLETLEKVPGIVGELSFLFKSRRRAEGLDLLVFAGSHQLNDFVGGPWAYPYTVLKWTMIAKRAGAKVVFLSLGAGPIDSWLGRRFLEYALKQASYRSYRDVTAKQVVNDLFGQADKVVPDLAFSLDSPVVPSNVARSGRPIVGINPMPLYTDYWHETDLAKYENYVRKLAEFADWLVARGCDVHFIPTQLRVDPGVITDVIERMAANGKPEFNDHIVEPQIKSLDELRSALDAVDIMVATRYHGILLSLALGKPVLAIAYHDKSRDLMDWLGLKDYVIEGDSFTAGALEDLIRLLETNRQSLSSALRRQLPEFRSAVQAQYDEVFRRKGA